MDRNYKEILADINTFIFDVDGVLTDGTITIMPDGKQVCRMNIKDVLPCNWLSRKAIG